MPSPTQRIVRATAADIPIIEQLARQVWPVTFGPILSPAQIDYMLDRMYRPEALKQQLADGHVFHLLLDGEGPVAGAYTTGTVRYRPVGYVSHQLNYLRDTTKIHKLYVLPETQGKGYGRLLVRKVEGLARRSGQKALRLDVNYQNPAIAFYERLGFEKLERYDTDIGDGFLMEDWVMIKLLT
ncbi:GNAT family N-acetyltransferase [Lewinella sp. IMCC34183]|uniref:GNAT family N-acetyltransferase n=1 Tax=Lewinella sp. IMCC34183 TaxID=2248762 RepID=UPI000E288032|nr:GNAT family N-acetyltransferase [Lewinella sp. IMCC34183]